MKRFRFGPERVLRLRTLAAEAAARAVARAAADLAAAQQRLAEVTTTCRHWEADMARRRRAGLRAVDWLADWTYLLRLRQRVEEEAAATRAAREALTVRRLELAACRQRQQALEKLKELRWREHRHRMAAAEQAAADDRAQHRWGTFSAGGGWQP